MGCRSTAVLDRAVSRHDTAAELAAMREAALAAGFPPANPPIQPLAEARVAAEAYYGFLNRDLPPIAEARDVWIADPLRPIRLRLVRDRIAKTSPAIVYVHGGGYVLNSVDTYERLLRLLALRTGATVIAVDYAKAPEWRFPRQHDEVLTALAWIGDHAGELGIDPDRVAVAGDSAGASPALAALVAARDGRIPSLAGGALLYGMYAFDFDTPSHRLFGGGEHGLSTARMRWFWDQFLSRRDDARDSRAVPLLTDPRGLAPVSVAAAGLDCLRDDSVRLAIRLQRAGVPHRYREYDALPHSFAQMTAHVTAANDAVTDVADDLKRILEGSFLSIR